MLRVGDETPRGYRRQELGDVFERYLPLQGAQQAQHTQHDARPAPENHGNSDVSHVAHVALPARVGVARAVRTGHAGRRAKNIILGGVGACRRVA